MGLFSMLFGGKDKKQETAETVEPVEYKGFQIFQEAMPDSGQFRVAGRITKDFDGEVKSHRFIRSDVVSNKDDANELMLKKSQMFIDQMGDDIFG